MIAIEVFATGMKLPLKTIVFELEMYEYPLVGSFGTALPLNVTERVDTSGTRASGIDVIAWAIVCEMVLRPELKSFLQMEA
ncbi:hypothetical protein, partial [Staphylococcus epidermidis]|uniref:hypothetical protein n=1 Tax=Staphylococcus epidermidis TaxID=1282 RepID=UPI0027395AA0